MSTPMPKFTISADILFCALQQQIAVIRKEMDLALNKGEYDNAEKLLNDLRQAGKAFWAIEPCNAKFNIYYQCNEIREAIPVRVAPPEPAAGTRNNHIPVPLPPAPVAPGPNPPVLEQLPRPGKAAPAHPEAHGDEQAKDINLFWDK